jgi:hypothetical protein
MRKLSWLDTAALAALPVMAVLATSAPGNNIPTTRLADNAQAHSCTRSQSIAELSANEEAQANTHAR